MEPGPALFFVAPAAAAGWALGLALMRGRLRWFQRLDVAQGQAPEPGSERLALAFVRTFWWEAGAPTEWAAWTSRREEA